MPCAVAKFVFFASCLPSIAVFASRPIIQTKFTADPAPIVHDGQVYLFTSHDEDDAEGFTMRDWLLYTSSDMVNWTDHGVVASLKDFPWYKGDNGAWAVQVVERDGKWFMYCPIHCNGIAVLVADSPFGPFKDPLGKTLIRQEGILDDIDPTVWIDGDGQAYLYWGNPNLYYVKLNRDMISYSGPIVKNPGGVKPKDYQEGPWLYKRDLWYYLAYASTCCPEGIGYAMSRSPTGPWRTAGAIMGHYGQSSGNHPGIITFKGKDYLFGFSFELRHRFRDMPCERRSVMLAELSYNNDGTIRELPFWNDLPPVDPAGALDPFSRVEAETIAWSEGVKTERQKDVGMVVTSIHDGDYIQVRNVDCGTGAVRFEAVVATPNRGGRIEIRLDALDGRRIGVCEIGCTRGRDQWKTASCQVEKIGGRHDLFLVFRGDHREALFDFDAWRLVQ